VPSSLTDATLKAIEVFMNRVRVHADGNSESLPDISETLSKLPAVSAPITPGAPAAAEPAKANGAAAPAQQSAPAQAAAPAPAVPEERPAVEETADQQSSWRVDTRQVLSLMKEVERLREARLRLEERRRDLDKGLGMLTKLTSMLAESAEARSMLMAVNRALMADGEEVGAIVVSLEDGLKAICTLPVNTILDPLQRAVRDLCRTTGKEARLSVVGGEVSLDRRVLEALRGPLVHLVRNSIDHGVEKPADRERRGKHREGALVIRVEQQGNMVFVEVSDDGNGIDAEKV
jgi:chemotaxis protein histidine kinase CheA